MGVPHAATEIEQSKPFPKNYGFLIGCMMKKLCNRFPQQMEEEKVRNGLLLILILKNALYKRSVSLVLTPIPNALQLELIHMSVSDLR